MNPASIAVVAFELSYALSACSVPSVRTPQEIVDQAELIAVVRAPTVYLVEPDEPDDPFSRGELEFEVLRVLKGRFPGSLILRGTLVDEDDYNDRPVPYDFIREAGRHGWCSALDYRAGAPYLFIMRYRDDGRPTPYWAPLAPTNEQLHPLFRMDPWFKWVRQRLSKEEAARRLGSS